ncbi:MAG: hypothetical protein K1X94_02120 [Sandaracinaceae bacterium]|nr:hypothetical protein [Sandaracinaceae bacterium]
MSTPSFRHDAWTNTWVAMAPGRFAIGAMRPGGLPPPGDRCPFCPGHEGDTERSTAEIGSPWRARAVLNRFPLTRAESALPIDDAEAKAAEGAHEVIVESRAHDRDLVDMRPDEALDVLVLWRDRMRALESLAGTRAVTLFRNKGRRAGSSQPHPHSQIVALPFVPPHVARRCEVSLGHQRTHGTSLVLHMLARERGDGRRIVEDADGVVSLCPYASPRAWCSRLVLDTDVPRFSATSDALLGVLARRLPDLTARALRASGATDYNVYVADPPVGQDTGFAIEIVPRTGGDAGFELSTGTSVCVVLPEDAAARMRTAGRAS